MPMRVVAHGMIVTALAAGAIVLSAQSAPSGAAAKVLADARAAMGGETKQAAVRTIVATGRSRRVSGDNLVPVEFEIDLELGDKYVRKDEIPPQEATPSSTGFNGDNLIQIPAPATRPSDAQRKARVAASKQDFARLMLGMFANSFSGFPLTFSYVGQAEAPQGKADVLDCKGQDNFAVRLLIHKDTHLPVMVSWTTPSAEARLFFSDYRDTEGLQFPYRIRRAAGSNTTEETTFDRFKINAKIDPRKFDIVK